MKSADGSSFAPTLLLQVWFSPTFPTGAFAYSHGLEFAQELGDLTNRETLRDWLEDLIVRGSMRGDIVLASLAHQAFDKNDDAGLRETCELALALSPSQERLLETGQQGNAFWHAITTGWPFSALARLGQVWQGDIALPVAAGVSAAGHGIKRGMLLPAFGLAALGNLVSAAVRLGIVGQTDGQRVISDLIQQVNDVSLGLCEATEADLCSTTFRSDLASLRHETQYTRLFRS